MVMLATTCPGCGTVFRVQTEQLRQRSGLVRCGVCHQVFNALEALQPVAEHDAELEPEDSPIGPADATPDPPPGAAPAAASTAPFRPPDPSPAVQPQASAPSRTDPSAARPSTVQAHPDAASAARSAAPLAPPVQVEPPARAVSPEASIAPSIANAPTAMPVVPPITVPDDPPHVETSPEALVRSSGSGSSVGAARAPLPVRPSVHVDIQAEASRTRAGARRTKRSTMGARSNALTRWWSADHRASPALAALVAVLAIAALLQALLLARHWLAVRVPSTRPALVALAGAFGLAVEPPRRLSHLALEQLELRPDSTASRLTLSAVLRNRGDTPIQWPAIELTLADSTGTVVVRRALLPNEYLIGTPARVRTGIAPQAELPLRLALEAPAAQWTRPTATLFYP